MQSDQRPLKSPQHREPEAGDLADSPTGTAAPALGPPQLPRPAPGSERGSSPPPAPRLGPSVQPQQQEVGQGAAEQADGVQLRPSSAPPHAPSDPEAGGQEPAHLLEMLAEEACHESSVATGGQLGISCNHTCLWLQLWVHLVPPASARCWRMCPIGLPPHMRHPFSWRQSLTLNRPPHLALPPHRHVTNPAAAGCRRQISQPT